ncbi:right-handed parallel beta-helix repeat-containing protein [Candidatus Woesearchaeota archaeon]|nr:right-handed parallel beta-helix repeat-containing protein [Candidatus Woesearchaeota archaeon]
MKKRFVLISLVLFLVPFVSAIDVDNCQTISSTGDYVLTQNITSSEGDSCVVINSDDVMLDLAGFYIHNSTISGAGGIVVNGSVTTNITIMNGFINHTETGILVESNGDITAPFLNISNITINNTDNDFNSIAGIDLRSRYVNVEFCTLIGTPNGAGIDTRTGYHNITNNTMYSNQYAIHFRGSGAEYINASYNNGSMSGTYDFYLNNAQHNTLTFNSLGGDLSSNGFSGVYLSVAFNNTINNNTFFNHTADIFLDPYAGENFCDNTIEDNVDGEGRTIYFSNSTINGELDNQTFGALILCDADNSTLNNITLLSTNPDYDLNFFQILWTDGSNITNSNVTNTQGIYLDRSSYNNSFINNTLNSSNVGFYLDEGNDYNTFINNTITYSGTAMGISSDYNTITENNFTVNYQVLSITGSYNNIENNMITNNPSVGIHIETLNNGARGNNTITNNTITGNERGINLLETQNDNNFSFNVISDNINYGIYIQGSEFVGTPTNNRIFNNTINSNTEYGVYLDTVNETNYVYDNTLNYNLLVGIYIYNTNNTYLTRNTANHNTYGIALTGVDEASLDSNVMYNNTIAGIYALLSRDINLSLNNATSNGGSQYLISESNVTFTDRNYAFGVPSNGSALNITNQEVGQDIGFVTALVNGNYSVLETDYVNFTFNNATNLTFYPTNNLSSQNVSSTTCASSQTDCLLASNLLIINNQSTGIVDNLTIYYNSSLLNSSYPTSTLRVGRYSDGWDSLGNVELNTDEQFVRLLSTVTNFSPFAAVAFNGSFTPPTVTALIPSTGTSFDTNESIEIGANISATNEVDTVLVNITLPNSTVTQLVLTLATGPKYNVSYTTPSLEGTYNVTFIANGTENNVNNTETTSFTVSEPSSGSSESTTSTSGAAAQGNTGAPYRSRRNQEEENGNEEANSPSRNSNSENNRESEGRENVEASNLDNKNLEEFNKTDGLFVNSTGIIFGILFLLIIFLVYYFWRKHNFKI